MNDLMIDEAATYVGSLLIPAKQKMSIRLNSLAAEVSKWETDMNTRSHEFLYRMLQNCYEIYLELTDTEDANLEEKKAAMQDFLEEKCGKKVRDKPLSYKIVRCVFGEVDRRRLSTYQLALNHIQRMEWEVEDIPCQIANAGGLAMLSQTRERDNTASENSSHSAGTNVTDAPKLACISSEGLASVFDADHVGERFAGVMTLQRDGTYTLHYVVHNAKAVEVAIKAVNKAREKRSKTSHK